jgi:hypothetical protein
MAPSRLAPNLYLGGSFASTSISSVDVGFVVHLVCHVASGCNEGSTVRKVSLAICVITSWCGMTYCDTSIHCAPKTAKIRVTHIPLHDGSYIIACPCLASFWISAPQHFGVAANQRGLYEVFADHWLRRFAKFAIERCFEDPGFLPRTSVRERGRRLTTSMRPARLSETRGRVRISAVGDLCFETGSVRLRPKQPGDFARWLAHNHHAFDSWPVRSAVALKLRERLRTRWHTGTAHLLADDDPIERQRWLAKQLPSSAANARAVAPFRN